VDQFNLTKVVGPMVSDGPCGWNKASIDKDGVTAQGGNALATESI
jgi:hypothetical protein